MLSDVSSKLSSQNSSKSAVRHRCTTYTVLHHVQDITHRVVVPELAFTGDTTADFITDPANEEVFKARLLIMECSFLDGAMPPENAKVQFTSNNGRNNRDDVCVQKHWHSMSPECGLGSSCCDLAVYPNACGPQRVFSM